MKCRDCAFYHKVEDWYYDECMQGPMTTLPDDPACSMYKKRQTKPIEKSQIQKLIDKFKKKGETKP